MQKKNAWHSNKYILRKITFRFYSVIFFIISLLLLTNGDFYKPIRVGLDPSYRIAFHLAAENNLIYGKDIIFTYGPLAYFSSRHPISISRYQYLTVDILVFILSFFILIKIFKNLNTYSSIFFAFLCTFMIGSMNIYSSDLDRYMYLMLIFFLLFHLSNNSIFALFIGCLLSIFVFYLKLSSGWFMMITLGVYFVYSLVFPVMNPRKKTLVFLFCFLGIFAAATISLNVDLINYLKSGFIITNSFADAMFIEIGENSHFLWMSVTVIFLIALIFISNPRRFFDNKEYLLMYLITSLFIFALYKYGVVRYEWRHNHPFFAFVPAAIGFFYLFSPNWNKPIISKVFIISLIFSFSIFGRYYKVNLIPAILRGLESYALEFYGLENYALQKSDLGELHLPDHILETISQQSVDVFPWEISLIYKYNLKYNPRPVIQTFTAYDEYLDYKNAEKLASKTAPDYLLFSLCTIDWRHPFFDESKTKLTILTNYKELDRFDNYLIMENRKNPIRKVEIVSEPLQSEIGEYIEIDFSDELIYLNTDIEYSLIGSIARLLFQPPRLKIAVQFSDGKEQTFNAIKSIITGDVLINKFVDSINSAQYFFEYGGRLNKSVKRVKFFTDDTWGFKPEFKYQFKTIQIKSKNMEKLEVLDLPFSEKIKLLGVKVKEINPEDIFVDLFWNCKLNTQDYARKYFAETSLNLNGVTANSDAPKSFNCSAESEEITITNHRILLNEPIMQERFYNLFVELTYEENGQIIDVDSITINHFIP